MEKRLDGKVIILTGAAMGLGRQTAIYLAERGAKLVITDIVTGRLLDTARLCEEKGAEVLPLTCDNMKYEDLVNLVNKTAEQFQTVDVLINNANKPFHLLPFLEQDFASLEEGFRVGIYAQWHLMKLCYPYMKGKNSSIINFISGACLKGVPGMAPYAADKAAIRGLSMVVAREWGKDGIRCNTIAPFAVTDNMTEGLTPVMTPEMKKTTVAALAEIPMGRAGDPYKDIAPAVAFLCSEDSQWITGQNICVSGGSSMWLA